MSRPPVAAESVTEMNQRNSARVGNSLVEFHAAENRALADGVPHRDTERVRSAIFQACSEAVPDDAIWTRIQRDGDNRPIIVALHGQQLYVLDVLDDDERGERPDLAPPAECQMVWIEPGAGRVSLSFRHRVAGPINMPRSAEWRFELSDGLTLTIPTYIGSDGEVPDPELFARALCQALGFEGDFGGEASIEALAA